jgi:uncharacterized RDD family membrane protein YckC
VLLEYEAPLVLLGCEVRLNIGVRLNIRVRLNMFDSHMYGEDGNLRKEEFMTELREGLSAHVAPDELEDILADYHEWFEEGLREGKTEEEVCAELGSPARTVKAILEEKSRRDVENPIPIADHQAQPDRFNQGHSPASAPPSVQGIAASTGPAHFSRAPQALSYAPLADRFAAWFIDFLLSVGPLAFFGVANTLPFAMLWPPVFLFQVVDPAPTPAKVIGAVACTVYFLAYHALFLSLLRGRTPGKMLLRLRVVHADGSPLRGVQIFGREFIGRLMLDCLTFGLSRIVSFVWSLLSAQNLTVHDAVGNTRVISEPPRRSRG